MPTNDGLEAGRQVDIEKLSVLTGTLLLTLVFMRFLEAPTRPLMQAYVLGSPVGIDLSPNNLMLLIVVGLSATASASMMSVQMATRLGQSEHQVMYWILPALLNTGLAVWLNRIDNLNAWSAALAACAVLIPVTLSVEYWASRPALRKSPAMLWRQTAIVHLAAVILFSLIYDARLRSLLSATSVLLLSVLLAARLFWIHTDNLPRAFKLGGLVGLILGQMTWGLNYWRLSGLQGGLSLLLIFYTAVGLIQQFLQGRFDDGLQGRQIVFEYGSVAAVTLLLIALASP